MNISQRIWGQVNLSLSLGAMGLTWPKIKKRKKLQAASCKLQAASLTASPRDDRMKL